MLRAGLDVWLLEQRLSKRACSFERAGPVMTRLASTSSGYEGPGCCHTASAPDRCFERLGRPHPCLCRWAWETLGFLFGERGAGCGAKVLTGRLSWFSCRAAHHHHHSTAAPRSHTISDVHQHHNTFAPSWTATISNTTRISCSHPPAGLDHLEGTPTTHPPCGPSGSWVPMP